MSIFGRGTCSQFLGLFSFSHCPSFPFSVIYFMHNYPLYLYSFPNVLQALPRARDGLCNGTHVLSSVSDGSISIFVVIGAFVLPFSQTSLVMVTLKAHGFNKNYS